ncbi:uncharacterized protein LOC131989127 [Centropristis striata]|uniref:uncharacterized protein LOC131989127 n=1 Tax=Centropristis striata TaxID=184440 RepID=UPI0027E1D3C8|nr:uncharacterized protein LOC131989127 [Centropristis striata]
MTLTRDFIAFLSFTAMVAVYHCKADRPSPPTGLSYRWLDSFTVNISWQKPSRVLDGEVEYKISLMKNGTESSNWKTKSRYFRVNCLTEDIGSDHCTIHISSVIGGGDSEKESVPVPINIHTLKPRVEVKDIRCLVSFSLKGINCSWIRGNQPVKLFYRGCGLTEGQIKPLQCNETYSTATRDGCYLQDEFFLNICLLMDTKDGMRTFMPALEILPPELRVKEEGDNLQLSWTPPETGLRSCWEYTVCYKQCKEFKQCLKFSGNENGDEQMKVAYDKRCRYDFQSKVTNTDHCPKIFSSFGDIVTYGTDEPPDETLTVVAIVVPVLLSLCIILSCYCFRKHSSILCPIIPDPSAIFKEMMMNGNKELKPTTGTLYKPMPEPIEPCKITLVTENSSLQENS